MYVNIPASTKVPIFPIFPQQQAGAKKLKESSSETDLNCPICFEAYNADAHAPVFARYCRHSICRKCLCDMGVHHRVSQATTGGSRRIVSGRRPAASGVQSSLFAVGGTTTSATSQVNVGVSSSSSSSPFFSINNDDTQLSCPTCRKGSFRVTQEPNFLAVCLLKTISQMKNAQSRRRKRGDYFNRNPILKLREKQLLANAAKEGLRGRFDEMDLLKGQMRALEAENTSLRIDNSDLLNGERAKENLAEILLKEKDKLLKALRLRMKENENKFEEKNASSNSTIAKLETTVLEKDAKIDSIGKSLEKVMAKAQRDGEHAKKTQGALFVALVALVLFSCFSIVFALMTPSQCGLLTSIEEA